MTNYENELVHILEDNGFFAKRGAGSTKIDVFAIYKSVPFTIEVKSSKDEKVYLSSERLKEQLGIYKEHKDKYNDNTLYMFRYKTRKNVDHRWEAYGLNMNSTVHGNSYLKYGEGIQLDVFIEKVKKKIDSGLESGVLKWYECENFETFLEQMG